MTHTLSLAELELRLWSICRRGGSAHIEGGIEGPYRLMSGGTVLATAPQILGGGHA